MGDKAGNKTKHAAKVAKKLRKADEKASKKAAKHRTAPPVRAAGFLAELADQPQLIATALATVGAGVVTRRPALIRGGARMLAAHVAATAVKDFIKGRVDRSRPEHALDGHADTLRPGDSDHHALRSFPSGHTAGAVAAARAVSRDVDGAAVPATLAAGAVAAAQPATGSHHLTDVVAGALVGWLSEAMVSAVFDRVEPAIERAWQQRKDAAAAPTAAA